MQRYIVTNGDITYQPDNIPVVVEATLVSCNTGPEIAAGIAIERFGTRGGDRLHVWRVSFDNLVSAGVVVYRAQNVDLEPAQKRMRT